MLVSGVFRGYDWLPERHASDIKINGVIARLSRGCAASAPSGCRHAAHGEGEECHRRSPRSTWPATYATGPAVHQAVAWT